MAARLTAYVVVGIVAATLIAGLIVGAQRDDSDGPIDLIIHNAKVYTATARGTMAEAIAIRGNQILRVGGERDVTRLRRPQTVMIDARGAAVLPGFNDAHLHFISGGLSLNGIDLTNAETIEDIQSAIRSWAELHAEDPWVLGAGWRHHTFTGGAPTRQMLDALVPDRPARIVSYDGQTSWVNTRALSAAGIKKRTRPPAQGTIAKDSRTGEPTGILKGAAMELVDRHLAVPTAAERARALRAAIDEAHRNGITSIQDTAGSQDEFQVYAEAKRDGDLRVRVYAALAASGLLTEAQMADLEAVAKQYPDDPLFKAGAIEIALDGSIAGHTAALLRPYANDPSAGTPAIAPDDFNRMVRLLDARGWQVLTRAAGDRAVRMALDAYEHAVRSNPARDRQRRHRIEHVEIVDPGDLPRFGALGVVASMQPFHGSPRAGEMDSWLRSLGPERGSLGWPYGSIAAAAGRVTFGSDWPRVPLNPLLTIHTAVTRTTPDLLPEGGWYPAERMALKAAIDAYTSGAAWASFDEQRKGTLEPGMLADLVILSEDIFAAPPSRLASTRVAVTIFDGKIVYQRDGAPTN